MKHVIDTLENYSLIKIEEEKVDTRISPDMKQMFVMKNSEGVANIILDLSSVKYIDSSGLSAILVGNRLCTNLKGILILVGLNEHVRKMLEISQLHNQLNVMDSVDDAIEAICLADLEAFDKEFNMADYEENDDEFDDIEGFDDEFDEAFDDKFDDEFSEEYGYEDELDNEKYY